MQGLESVQNLSFLHRSNFRDAHVSITVGIFPGLNHSDSTELLTSRRQAGGSKGVAVQ